MPDKSRTPVIVGAARTPIGKFLGALSTLSAPELGAVAIREALKRSKVPAEDVQEVIMGHVIQGGTGQAPARQAALKAGLPATVSAVTVNKVCGSGLKAVMLASQAIKAGDVERPILRLRNAKRRQAERPENGRRYDQGWTLVRLM